MITPLDEFPLHQTPLPLVEPASSDRNFYDRCYLNAHDRTGDIFLISGFGIYPNLGVKDAYITIGRGGINRTVRFSDALDSDRMNQSVGGYKIIVERPLDQLRLVCEDGDWGASCDITWRGSFPVVQEQPHIMTKGDKVILNACRFAQVGTWEGTISVDGTDYEVTPDRWVGTRDRSWGIRPVGEAEPSGRGDAEMPADWGMWWLYTPLRFDDFALVLIVQEDGSGHRVLNDATMTFGADSGRAAQQMGWPRAKIDYVSGTRTATGATIWLTDPDGGAITVEIESLGYVALNCGPGYGPDPEWTHGQWRGREFVLSSVTDQASPDAAGRVPFATVDHVARAVCKLPDGSTHEGWGLFEHMSVGAHSRSGFTDFFSVAP